MTDDDPTLSYRIVKGELPPGVSFDARTGCVTGTPTEVGRWEIEIEVEDIPVNGRRYIQRINETFVVEEWVIA